MTEIVVQFAMCYCSSVHKYTQMTFRAKLKSKIWTQSTQKRHERFGLHLNRRKL